ncbi:MAG: bifunctional precorrin-2 dehydrogenase/sirohydrochlorin ferrochelatase [Actinobacteria bacterium]|nr:bifunctional precorrin-2 dehydrogenase/sirohydrochlorin ferrochelatase [Actinomycetota bacterium]
MSASDGNYPVVLDLRGRSCLVVGAGRIAARKIAGLVAAGAIVTVVAPEVDEAVHQAAEGAEHAVTIEQRAFRPGDVRSRWLAITATGNPSIDRSVAAAAETAGVWVNSADDPANCTFTLPALHRDAPVVVAVSSAGVSPALTSWLRDRVGELCDDLFGGRTGEVAATLAEARARVKATGCSTETIDWRALLDGPFIGMLRDGHVEEARRLVDATIAEVR